MRKLICVFALLAIVVMPAMARDFNKPRTQRFVWTEKYDQLLSRHFPKWLAEAEKEHIMGQESRKELHFDFGGNVTADALMDVGLIHQENSDRRDGFEGMEHQRNHLMFEVFNDSDTAFGDFALLVKPTANAGWHTLISGTQWQTLSDHLIFKDANLNTLSARSRAYVEVKVSAPYAVKLQAKAASNLTYPGLRVAVPGAPVGIPISNVIQLQAIGNDPLYPLDGSYYLTDDIDASDTVNWNYGAGFVPIGTYANPFTGIFDGQGHVISGLYISVTGSNDLGMFASIRKAAVNNLTLLNTTVSGKKKIGALCGSAIFSQITDVNVVGCSVTGTNNGVGGMAGWGDDVTTFTRCSTSGTVVGAHSVGGLVGWLGQDSSTLNCFSTASVTGSSTGVGGLIGASGEPISGIGSARIWNCYAAGAVSGTTLVGGLLGELDVAVIEGVHNCFWDTTTSGQPTSAAGTGKTTALMEQRATYTGWDFVHTWTFDASVSLAVTGLAFWK